MSRTQGQGDIPSSLPSIYTSYLCREPTGDVPLLINNGPDEYTALLRTLQRSADHWVEKDHIRTVERVQFEIARLHMQNKQWQRAMRTLVPLWQTLTWRQAGWWSMLEEVDEALKECAISVRDAETLVAVEWELMNRSLTKRQDGPVDFRQALKRMEGTQARPRAVLRSENILSCVSATFAFGGSEGNVGISLDLQLVLSSHAHQDSSPIKLAQVRIAFEGGLKNISIHHRSREGGDEEQSPRPIQIQQISLQTPSSASESTPTSPTFVPSHALSASADLTIAPGQTSVLSLNNIPRDAGEVEVSSITAYLKEEDFDLELVISEDEQLHQAFFWVSGTPELTKRPLKAGRSSAVKILPKPPKMQIGLPSALNMYYVDEEITLDLEITNEEEEPATGSLEVRLLGPPEMHAEISWTSETESSDPLGETALKGTVEDGHQRLPTRQIGAMESGSRQNHKIRIRSVAEPAEYSLQIEARYSLLSDPETPISKIFTADLVFVQPFEATFSFHPLIHPDPWPNYFDIEDMDDSQNGNPAAGGLIQRWSLTSRLTSLATDSLAIESISPQIGHILETATCRISPTTTTDELTPRNPTSIDPSSLQEHTHTLDIQKLDLEDRHALTLEFDLQIRYRRSLTSPITTTTLPIQPLPLPFGEPRVLAASNTTTDPHTLINLSYTLENPSAYTLTFNLTMDNNEDFAFSGSKSVNVHLLPLSRHTVEYRLLPLVRGSWLWPHCVVVDTGFRKTLRILAAEGVRSDRKGGVGVWVDAVES